MVAIVLASVGGFFILILGVLLWTPIRVSIHWRKLWTGPWAITSTIYVLLPLHQKFRCPTIVSRLGQLIIGRSQRLPSAPPQSSKDWHQVRQRLRFAASLRNVLIVERSTWQLELGFEDPSLTGHYLGLLYGLPKSYQQPVRLNFERVGFCSRGKISLRCRLLHLLWHLLCWWWKNRKYPVA